MVATSSSWVDEGVNWGSGRTVRIHAPRVALAWDTPTSGYSAGATRYLLERKLGYPVTPIRVASLQRADLSGYQVLIVPDSFLGYAGAVRSAAIDRLRAWVRTGGTLISWGAATAHLADEDVDLVGSRIQKRPSNGTAETQVLESESDLLAAIQPTEEEPDNVAGVLLRARVDRGHWLAAGLPESVNVLFSGRRVFDPVKIDRGVNVVSFAGPEEILVSGHLWEENRVEPQGRGLVVAFTGDPTTRAYVDGLDLLVANAVFRGSAHARPSR